MTTLALPHRRAEAAPRDGLLRALVLLMAAVPALALLTPSDIPSGARQLAALLWVLCLAPSWTYLRAPRETRPPIPFLPLIGLVYLFYYPLQVVLGASNVAILFQLDPAVDYDFPVQLALAGWCALLLGYHVVRGFRRGRKLARSAGTDDPRARSWGLLLVGSGLVIDLASRFVPVPPILGGLLHFTSFLTLLGVALLTVLNVRGRLRGSDRLVLLAGIVVATLLRAGTGTTSTLVILALIVFLSVWAGGGRVTARWVMLGLASVLLLVAVRGVVLEYRRQSWFVQERLTPVEQSALIVTLLRDKVREDGVRRSVEDGWTIVAGRSANLDLFADVVRKTPAHVPYWEGSTYLSLVGFAVPRVLWPNKPAKTLGQDFGHRYGYLDPQDTYTSINFPFLIEFYANFGEAGVLVGMLLVGMIYRALDTMLNRPGQPLKVTVCALVLLVPLLNIESDFSLVFGGLFMNGIALALLFRVLERTYFSRPARARSGGGPAAMEELP